MKTAVDSSVLLDVLGADPTHGQRSRDALRAAYDAGKLVACDVVWAEVRAHFDSDAEFDAAMTLLGLEFEALRPDAAHLAGSTWRNARRRGPLAPKRVIADFLIGAHATLQADTLLTRNRGYYRAVFRDLKVVDPSR